MLYTQEAQEDYLDAAARACAQIHASEEPGAVLVFLPGQEDIETVQGLLEDLLPTIIQGGGGDSDESGSDSDSDDDDDDDDDSGSSDSDSEKDKKKDKKGKKAKKGKNRKDREREDKSMGLSEEAKKSLLKRRELQEMKNNADPASDSSTLLPSKPSEVIAQFDDFVICPLYASLPPAQQMEAFQVQNNPRVREYVVRGYVGCLELWLLLCTVVVMFHI